MIAFLLAGALAFAAPVSALGVTLDLPETVQATGSTASTAIWTEPSDGTVWTIERRGDGTMTALPLTLAQAARMIPDALGAAWTDPPMPTRLGVAEASRIRFGVGDREARSWAFLSDGYLYALTVVTKPSAVAARAEHLSRTARVPEGRRPTLAPLDLAQLGLSLPGAGDLKVTTVTGAIPTVVLLDAPARAGLILARMPASTSAYTGKPPAAVRAVLEREGCKDVRAEAASFGGLPAVVAHLSRADGKGDVNAERVVVFTRGDSTWLLRATTQQARASELDAWADKRLAGARVLR